MQFTAEIHLEDGTYWARVKELPGVFATGDTFDELFESLQEGISLYLDDDGSTSPPLQVATAMLQSAVPA